MEYEQLATSICVYVYKYHTAVGELLECERVPKNAVYTCCGSEDGCLLDTEKVVADLP